MKIRITFIEEMLATLPGNKEIARDFVAAKNPNGPAVDEAEVIENMSDILEKQTMYFARTVLAKKVESGRPFLYDYQVKGFFKGACQAMIDSDTFTKEELRKYRLTRWSYKRTIESQIHVRPRKVFFELPDGTDPQELSFCERPLRGDTPKGERIALARSEAVPAGTSVVVTIAYLNPKLVGFIKTWLDFGQLIGIGGWRNSGKGRFEVVYLEQSEAEAKVTPSKPTKAEAT